MDPGKDDEAEEVVEVERLSSGVETAVKVDFNEAALEGLSG